MYEYPGYEAYARFDHIRGMFTQRYLVILVYVINTRILVTDYCILFAHAPVMFTTQTDNLEIINLTFLYL